MDAYFALRSGDLSKLDVLAESFTFIHPLAQIHGRDAYLTMHEELAEAFPHAELTVDELLVGENMAMWEWRLRGTHTGRWRGVEPTNRRFEISGMSKTILSGEKVVSSRAYFDSGALLRQLGLDWPLDDV